MYRKHIIHTDQEEETKEIIEYGGEDNNNMVSARPRRMSEIPDPPQPIQPIPEGSAFFILPQTSRCEALSTFIIVIEIEFTIKFTQIPLFLFEPQSKPQMFIIDHCRNLQKKKTFQSLNTFYSHHIC